MVKWLLGQASIVTSVYTPTDTAQAARNQAKTEEVKRAMGDKWVLHPNNRVKKGQLRGHK